MIVLPRRRLKKSVSFSSPLDYAAAAAAATDTQSVSSALNLLHINLQKGCSSAVYPSSDAERSSSDRIPSPSPSPSPSIGSPCGSPITKPHKSNDTAWDYVQALKSPDGNLDISHFKLMQRVGGGDIGIVFLAELVNSSSSYRFAVKIMDKEHLVKRNKLSRIATERRILEMLDHPFLPTLYGSFETSEHACFVMDFCPGGDLHKLRQRQPKKRFDEETVRFYAAEVLLALEYLHMMGVVYRDLKPENVLVRDDGHIMLTDFDLSLEFDAAPSMLKPHRLYGLRSPSMSPFLSCANPSPNRATPSCVPASLASPKFLKRHGSLPAPRKQPESSNLKRSTSSLPQLNVEPAHLRSMSFVGTHEYLAPEIIAGGGHGGAVDWWTLGIFIYELLYGHTPFKGTNNDATLMNAFSKSLLFPSDVEVSLFAKDLIKSLLVKDPKRRLGFGRGAADIKTHHFFEDINWPLIRWSQPPLVPKPFIKSTTLNQAQEQSPQDAAKDPSFDCF
ncbi:serine/threonine-protein kinase D6PK [Selaginella moellendorffii]|nr:serine/threonine-protein kinase D6PK [Selaginella moellendorffii]|eukprot:XP_002962458.2 serine/threonine-protein kinase D6PK [Selaginella moellendorffii]